MGAKKVEPVVSDRLAKKICWRFAPLMILMYLLSALDRANIGYAALVMNRDLGMSVAEFGTATSFFYVGYILFQTPANVLMHRLGARLWLGIILVIWGALSSVTSIVSGKDWLYVMRLLLGIAESGLFPGIVLYLTLWLPSRNRVWLMSMFVTALPLSMVVGAPISTALMSHRGVFGLSGWRSMLLLEGLPAILVGLYVFLRLPNSPKDSKWLSPAELAEVDQTLRLEKEGSETAVPEGSVLAALVNSRVWILGIVYFAINTGIVILLYFLPQVIKTFETAFGIKYSVFEVGTLTSIPFGFAAVCVVLWARFVGRRGISAMHIAAPLVLCAAALAITLVLSSPIQVMAAFAVAAAMCFAILPPFWQLPSRFLSGKAAAVGIGLINGIGASSGVFLPYAIGWIKDTTGSFQPAFLVIAGIMMTGAVIVMLLEMLLAFKGSNQLRRGV